MRWTVHGERSIYTSHWVNLALVDVEIPGGERFEHHVVRLPRPAAGVVIHRPDQGVLLLWRHRFITNAWGWEIPAGAVEAGEDIESGARREALEETGWRVNHLVPLITYHPMHGVSDQTFHTFLSTEVTHQGDPSDPSESERVEWVTVPEIRRALGDGRVPDGLTATALAYALAFGRLKE